MSKVTVMKIVVVGPGAVGKTLSCWALTERDIPSHTIMTIGAGFYLYQLKAEGLNINLHLWDLAGQDRFGSVRRMYYKGLKALVLMFDLTRSETIDYSREYLEDEILACINDEDVGCIAVIGNKRDLSKDIVVSDEQISELAQEVESKTGINTIWFTTSVYEEESVKHAFHSLVKCSLETRTSSSSEMN